MKYLPQIMATLGAYSMGIPKDGNLSDVFLAGGVYFVNRALGLPKVLSAMGAAGAVCAGELAQKVGLLPGTYDPKDFVAAVIGAGLALGIDAISSKIREREGGLVEALEQYN